MLFKFDDFLHFLKRKKNKDRVIHLRTKGADLIPLELRPNYVYDVT